MDFLKLLIFAFITFHSKNSSTLALLVHAHSYSN